MEYILAPKAPLSTPPGVLAAHPPCIFCDLPAAAPERLRENLVLVVNDDYAVMLNRYPFTAGHLLIIPRRHVSCLHELSDAETAALFRAVSIVGHRMYQSVKPLGINYGVNEGAAAGAGIAEHLHVHVVPRWPGDTNFMPVVADVRVMPEHLDATYLRLLPALADLPGARVLSSPELESSNGQGTP